MTNKVKLSVPAQNAIARLHAGEPLTQAISHNPELGNDVVLMLHVQQYNDAALALIARLQRLATRKED